MVGSLVITVISFTFFNTSTIEDGGTMTDYTTINKVHLLLVTKMAAVKMAERYRYKIGGN